MHILESEEYYKKCKQKFVDLRNTIKLHIQDFIRTGDLW
jgi:hypothetical protein